MQKTLTLPKKPPEEPERLRFIERKGRYILQEKVGDRWRDVPLIREENA